MSGCTKDMLVIVPGGDRMPLFIRVHLAAAAALLAFLSATPARAADRQPQIPELNVEKYTLPNGLDVLLLEDHTAPVVSVNIWYKVGSKNEKRGRTGLAHLFEHLMFEGSAHHDRDYRAPLEKLGAHVNGFTERRPHELFRDASFKWPGARPLARV